MDYTFIKEYLDHSTIKVVDVNWSTMKLAYKGINQLQSRTDATPEELTRAVLLTRLVNEFGYKPERIEIEREYTSGRPHTLTSRIDVVVRDARGDAFLFIEVKNPSEYATIDKDEVIKEQLFKVAGCERTEGRDVKYLVLYTIDEKKSGVPDECIIIDNKKYAIYTEWEAQRNFTNTLPALYGKAMRKPYIKASSKDLDKNLTSELLNQLQNDLHNVLWGGGGTDDNEVFSSLTNLILSKIQDEDEKEDGQLYDFQSLTFEKDGDEQFETNEQLFDRINNLYRRALKNKLNITDEEELNKSYVIDTKKFSLAKLKYTVQKLEGLSFVDGKNSLNGKDILGDFFEGIIRDGFKQSKGQFFTHINVVRFMLYAMQADRLAIKRIKSDHEIPYMMDPSAGSGTFLIEYMKFITKTMKYTNRNSDGYNANLGTTRAVKDKVTSDWFFPDNRENKWAQTYIYGSEINFNLGTATKVNMILHGDGSTNIFVKDGLSSFDKYEKASAPNALNQHTSSDIYFDKEVNEQFDLILTNPPFSVELDNETKNSVKNDFLFGTKKNSENLFIERWYQLLREKGRLAAVLPESVFDTLENKYIRLFIFKYFNVKAIVSLPQLTFEPYTSTKTSILFAQKKSKEDVLCWDEEWKKASQKYLKMQTQVLNIIDVIDGKKKKEKLPSIAAFSPSDEKNLLVTFLKDNFNQRDADLSSKEIVEKYRNSLEDLCSIDKDTKEIFGYVNTWWVFKEVSSEINYPIFMAEAGNIGYKRTKRGTKIMPNELYRTDINENILIDDGVVKTILDYMRDLTWE